MRHTLWSLDIPTATSSALRRLPHLIMLWSHCVPLLAPDPAMLASSCLLKYYVPCHLPTMTFALVFNSHKRSSHQGITPQLQMNHRTLLSVSLVTFKPLHSGKEYTQTGSPLSLFDSDFCHLNPTPAPASRKESCRIPQEKKCKTGLTF